MIGRLTTIALLACAILLLPSLPVLPDGTHSAVAQESAGVFLDRITGNRTRDIAKSTIDNRWRRYGKRYRV